MLPSLSPICPSRASRLHRTLPCFAAEPLPMSIEPASVFDAGMRNHHIANTAYPIAHTRTVWRYRKAPEEHEALLREAFAAQGRMSLYAHIPFCENRCAYCEYTVVDRHELSIEERYHAALLRELDVDIERLGLQGTLLVGFDIGGGTPSILDPARIGELVARVHRGFRLAPDYGISIETTPKIAANHPERLAAYRSFGIDRISMGLQMVNAHLLQAYGRDGNASLHARAAEQISKAGFRRFNVDLMYGFASQTPADFASTIAQTLELHPDVITLYRMRYKGTRVAAEAADVELSRVVELSELAHRLLADAGFHANPGKNTFSRDASEAGTSAYLTERVVWSTPYLGIGLGAQTFTNNVLAYNHGAASKKMDRYLGAVDAGQLPIQDLYHLPPSEGMAKMIAVSFYFGEINLAAFALRFGISLERAFPREVAFAVDHGLMEYAGRALRLTRAGARCFPGVVSLFYSDAVKSHLMSL
ncbi:MAG: radical SAM protein [Deltaproteobacteria bacterium]|nr:radical SAM protein [Deltaproteobacteria bacterium]